MEAEPLEILKKKRKQERNKWQNKKNKRKLIGKRKARNEMEGR